MPASTALAAAATVAALAVVFVLDCWTDEAPVQHLYYLPIVYAAVRFGTRGGLLSSLAAIILYHLAKPSLWHLGHNEADVLQVLLFSAVGPAVGRLTHDARHLFQLAMTDDLTGLHNLRSFNLHLNRLIAESRRAGSPLALMVLDLDRLKALNDEHGHTAGADAVRALGQIIDETLPPDAIACRYGGDEFVAVLPRCSVVEARLVADVLRERVQQTPSVLAGMPFPRGTLSVSIGVVSWICAPAEGRADGTLGEWLFQAADASLYAAKRLGRNRVHVGRIGPEARVGAPRWA